MDIKINSIVSLLHESDPELLEALRRRYPRHETLLIPGMVLGSEDDDVSSDTQFLLALLTPALTNTVHRTRNLIGRIRSKLTWAKRLRLLGGGTSTITSVGIIAALLADATQMQTLITAGVNLFGGFMVLAANHMESHFGEEKNGLYDAFQNLIRLQSKTETMLMNLKARPATYWIDRPSQVNEKIAEINETIANLTEYLLLLK